MHDTAVKTKSKSRAMTPEGRAKIVADIKARWAAQRAKREGNASPETKPSARRKSRTMSAEARGKIATAQRKRWAKGAPNGVHPAPENSSNPQSAIRDPQLPDEVRDLDPDTCMPSPFNRDFFAEAPMEELIANVKKHGVLQGGIVRPVKDPAILAKGILYEIVAGERRCRAAKAARRTFPAKIRDCTDLEAIELQAIENMFREDLNALDEARKFAQLRDAYRKEEPGRTVDQAIELIAVKTGKAKSTIFERLTLLNLPSQVQIQIQHGLIPPSHAAALTKLKDPVLAIVLAGRITHPKNGEGEDGILPFRDAKKLIDAECQREKNLAAWTRESQEFKAKGFGVLSPAQSLDHLGQHTYGGQWWVKGNTYIKADEQCNLAGASYRPYNKLWKKAPLPILGRLPDGRPVTIYDKSLADELVRAGGKLRKVNASAGQTDSDYAEKEREKMRAHNLRKKQIGVALGAIVKEIECNVETGAFWRFFAGSLVGQWRSEPIKRLLKRRGWGEDGRLKREMKNMACGELRGLCAEILLWAHAPSMDYESWNRGLLEACALFKAPLPAWDGNGMAKLQTPGEEEEEAEDATI